jgi:phage terminase Nu1 subunit (DNA packaging protein)
MIVKIGAEAQSPRLDDYMDRLAFAAFVGVSPRTLDRWHTLKLGPPRIKIGNHVMYRTAAGIEWLRQNESGGQASR